MHNDFGLSSSDLWCGLEHRQKLVGDFDLQVDFADFQGEHTLGVNYMQTGLLVSDMPFEESTRPSNLSTNCFLSRSRLPVVGGDNQCYQVNILKTGGVAFNSSVASTDLSGKLRIVRSGNTVTAYRDVSGSWSLMGTYSSFGSADLYAGLLFTLKESLGSVRFTNFQRVTPSDPFPTLGTFVSRIYNAGRSVTWGDISWNESLPGGTDLEFQVAVASSPAGPWNFVGPDGTAGTRFSTAGGEALPSLTDQYIRYIAYLTGGGSATPEFNQVSITYGGNLPWSLRVFDIDDAGNLTAVTTTDAAGVSSDVRDNPAWPAPERLNDLNQILRQDLTPAGGSTTSWAYTWDANGNLLTRDDGSNTWTYSWNDENRLTRVQGPGGVDVSYVYDGSGRMLQRIAADTTLFRWDGWDCYQEETNGDTTTYFLPDGQLRSFERGGDIYQCHSDALGSVRMVTDNTGAVVARFDYSAWGDLLTSSFDNVPGGLPYGFVGALGVRFDSATGLYYMRARWYDVATQRFISRDPIRLDGGPNLYAYVANSPTNFIDPMGLQDPRASQVITPNPTLPQPAPPMTTTVTDTGSDSGSGSQTRPPSVWSRSFFWLWVLKMYYDENKDRDFPRDDQGRPAPQPQPGPSPTPTPNPDPGGGNTCKDGWTLDADYCSSCFPKGSKSQINCGAAAMDEYRRCQKDPCGKKKKLPNPPQNWKNKKMNNGTTCGNYKRGGKP